MTASIPFSSFNVTASIADDATISIPSDDPVSMVPGGAAVNSQTTISSAPAPADDPAATSDGGAAAPSGLTTSPSSSPTGPIDASTVLGDETKEGSACVQECIAGFDSCPAPQNNNQRRHWWQATQRSVNSVDCFTLAKCYLVQPPWQEPPAPTPGTNINPEDPNAQAGPAAKPHIDMGKVNGVCSDACDKIENRDVTGGQGKPYNLDGLWNCLKVAQAGP